MIKKIVLTVVALLVVLTLLGGVKALQIGALIAAGESMVPPPEAVSATAVKADQWESSSTAVGSVTAVQGVTVSAEVAGVVTHIAFESGATVKAGDLLVELDSSVEKAQLEAAQATLQLSDTTLKRNQELRGKNTISQSELDAAEAQSKQAKAEVLRLEATIAKKTLRAPFAGRLGIRQVNLGQFLNAGGAVVTLQSLDPVYGDFSMPQQRLASLREGLQVRLTSDAAASHVFEGKISAISNEVDVATRTVKIRAEIPNPDGQLRPGVFGTVEVVQTKKRDVLYIPITAVMYAPYGNSVYVVEAAKEGQGKVARQQFVRLGASRGDFVEVEEGVKQGDTIVSAGAFKLRNGVNVTIVENNVLDPKLNPTPTDS